MKGESEAEAGKLLYVPSISQVVNSYMYHYICRIEKQYDVNYNNNYEANYDRSHPPRLTEPIPELPDYVNDVYERYARVHRWSIECPKMFWSDMWDAANFIDADKGDVILVPGNEMIDAVFFPNGYLNYAQQLLRFYNDEIVIKSWVENIYKFQVSHRQLYDRVSIVAQALKDFGLKKGDRVCGILPNTIHPIVCMLATVSLGGVWSSASPDFGVNGLIDRFGQVEPKLIFFTDCYYYKGKQINCIEKGIKTFEKLPTAKKLIFCPCDDTGVNALPIPSPGVSLKEFTKMYTPTQIKFVRTNFNDPLYVLFSSGTTGLPKCIVHRVGLVLQLFKEHRFHDNMGPGDRIYFATSCGWMLWNWIVTTLACEVTLSLYDGNPYYPKVTSLFDFITETGATFMGFSVKYLQGLMNNKVHVIDSHPMPLVKTFSATGSPLIPEYHEYFYKHIRKSVTFSTQTGGTDLCSSFNKLSNIHAVFSGELMPPTLGMGSSVVDDKGNSYIGVKGEFVCIKPFPAQPIGFINDKNNERYRKSYYETVPGVWAQGDYAELTKHYGCIVYGRSDAVLNPGGVRIGTSEIYRVVEDEDFVQAAAAIARYVPGDMDVVLFVLMKEGETLTESRKERIRQQLRMKATARHIPKEMYQVKDLPYTKTGKLAELAIRAVINNQAVKNSHALDNPASLENFYPYRTLKNKL